MKPFLWCIAVITMLLMAACGQSTIPPLAEPNMPTMVLIYTDT